MKAREARRARIHFMAMEIMVASHRTRALQAYRLCRQKCADEGFMAFSPRVAALTQLDAQASAVDEVWGQVWDLTWRLRKRDRRLRKGIREMTVLLAKAERLARQYAEAAVKAAA